MQDNFSLAHGNGAIECENFLKLCIAQAAIENRWDKASTIKV